MTACERLQCVIIGEGTLPIICGEVLRERGHAILALISPDAHAQQWAEAKGISHAGCLDALPGLVGDQTVDHLFSIVNFQRLPPFVLKLAAGEAINYHDSPLPRYAGMHATSWALLHGETRHAVTWHRMTQRTDGGDILQQVPVEIDADDTAWSLNAKCFEAAIAGFHALLDDLESNAVNPRPQDALERTFFHRSQRPPAGCTLPFDASAEHLHAMLRALDFGPYANPLGLPKILLGDSFAIVTELEVLDCRSGELPGTIVAMTVDGLTIATASDDVALAGFLTIDGEPMAIAEVVELGELQLGARLPTLRKDRAARLDSLLAEWSGHEQYWVAQLKAARPTTISHAPGLEDRLRRRASHALALDCGSCSHPTGETTAEHLLAVLMAYLARLTGSGTVCIGFGETGAYEDIGDLGSFFSSFRPLRVVADQAQDFTRFARALSFQVQQLRARGSYGRDAPLRDPTLRTRLDTADVSAWPILVEVLDHIRNPEAQTHEYLLTVQLRSDGKACTWLYDPDVLSAAVVERMARQFTALLHALPDCAGRPIRALPLLEEAVPVDMRWECDPA